MNRREFLLGATVASVAVPAALSAQHPVQGMARPRFALTVLNPDCMVGGAGQCCVLRMPSGKVYLFDAGNGDCKGEKTKNNGKDIIAPWLRARGITKIDGLVISHYHADHFGGFLWLKDHFEIGRVFNNNYTPSLETLNVHDVLEYKAPRQALDDWGKAHPGCLVENVKFGDDLGWSEEGVSVEVVWPPREGPVKPIENRKGYTAGDNHFHHLLNGNSTALRITANGKVFFIVGDIQADYVAEYMRPYLLEKGLWGGDFLVLPSHGTKPNETAATVADMIPAPRAVVASLGNLPWMIGAGKSIVKIYTEKGIAAYSTNIHGDVTVSADDGKLSITTDVEQRYVHDPR